MNFTVKNRELKKKLKRVEMMINDNKISSTEKHKLEIQKYMLKQEIEQNKIEGRLR